jgi:hypothetical protein
VYSQDALREVLAKCYQPTALGPILRGASPHRGRGEHVGVVVLEVSMHMEVPPLLTKSILPQYMQLAFRESL